MKCPACEYEGGWFDNETFFDSDSHDCEDCGSRIVVQVLDGRAILHVDTSEG